VYEFDTSTHLRENSPYGSCYDTIFFDFVCQNHAAILTRVRWHKRTACPMRRCTVHSHLVQLGRYLIRNCHLICSTFLAQILYRHIYTDEVVSHKPSKTCKNNLIILLSLLVKRLRTRIRMESTKNHNFRKYRMLQAGMRCVIGWGLSLWGIALIHVAWICI
jgi:hypothetical protein